MHTTAPQLYTASGTARTGVLEPPRRLGQWELTQLLGEGTLSLVYQARPAGGVNRPAGYAVKMLKPQWQDDSRMAALFCREAIVARDVSNAHLIAILTSQIHLPPYYLVSPYLRGCSMLEQLRRQRPTVPFALWVARQVAEALQALHIRGWLHNDVKPANIFISPEGHATLLDLGFARKLEETSAADDRPLLGTFNYMAPELLTSMLRADHRSDLYSLGATLFEMLTGKAPIQAHDLSELALLHRHGQRANLRALAPHLPVRLVKLVDSLLAKDPLRRPNDAQELINKLVSLEIESLVDRIPA